MIETERQDLRDYLAREAMGYVVENPTAPRWLQRYFNGLLVDDYRPDSPNSPASQLLGVIDKMRQRGFILRMVQMGNGEWEAWFNTGRMTRLVVYNSDMLLTICLAARAVLEGEK